MFRLNRPVVAAPLAWVCAVLALASAASGETIEFSVEGSLSNRLISLDVREFDGVRYVSLRTLVEQSGGAFSVLPTRARVDLFGETAWVKAGDARVHALSPFSLSRPIIQDGDHLLIAVDDLPGFFQNSFRKNAKLIGPGATAPENMNPVSTVIPPTPTSTAPRPVVPPLETQPGALEGLAPRPASRPKEYRTLVIDAGHGGYDTGAQSGKNVNEDELTLAIAQLVKGRLAAGGPIQSLLTRESDANLSPAQRTSAITAVRPDFVVSIHVGTSLSPDTRGVAAFYSPPTTIRTGSLLSGGSTTTTVGGEIADESRRLARAVGSTLAQSTGVPLRGVVQAPLRSLGDLGVPSVLIEVGCLSNEAAAQALLDPVYQGRIADGIVKGIQAFVANEDPTVPPAGGEDAAVEPEN